MLTGDFNLPNITWSETGGELASNPTYGFLLNNTFLNIMNDFSLEQLVLSPTRENHILDLVLTSIPGLFTDVTVATPVGQVTNLLVSFINTELMHTPK